MDWLDEIISLYLEISEEYKNTLWACCQRFSSYANLSFSDEEVMTIYLSGTLRGYELKSRFINMLLTTGNIYFQNLQAIPLLFRELISCKMLSFVC